MSIGEIEPFLSCSIIHHDRIVDNRCHAVPFYNSDMRNISDPHISVVAASVKVFSVNYHGMPVVPVSVYVRIKMISIDMPNRK